MTLQPVLLHQDTCRHDDAASTPDVLMFHVMTKHILACLQDDPAASAAVSASMEQLDFAGLLMS
jgi:hypothetical protein